jgi:hypothetical protein
MRLEAATVEPSQSTGSGPEVVVPVPPPEPVVVVPGPVVVVPLASVPPPVVEVTVVLPAIMPCWGTSAWQASIRPAVLRSAHQLHGDSGPARRSVNLVIAHFVEFGTVSNAWEFA